MTSESWRRRNRLQWRWWCVLNIFKKIITTNRIHALVLFHLFFLYSLLPDLTGAGGQCGEERLATARLVGDELVDSFTVWSAPADVQCQRDRVRGGENPDASERPNRCHNAVALRARVLKTNRVFTRAVRGKRQNKYLIKKYKIYKIDLDTAWVIQSEWWILFWFIFHEPILLTCFNKCNYLKKFS